MRSLARTVGLVFVAVVVIPMGLVLLGNDILALAVFMVLPLLAIISAIVLIVAARSGPSIPMLNYVAVMLTVMAVGAGAIGALALMTVLQVPLEEPIVDVIVYSVILSVTGIPGPVFLLLYRGGYFER